MWNPQIITKFLKKMRSDSADQKKDRHGMVNMTLYSHNIVPAKIMLYISMETGPATLSPVAEVEPCSAQLTSAFWSRRPPAIPCDSTATVQVAGRGCRRSLVAAFLVL